MSNGYATEDLEAILEALEADEAAEADGLAEQRMRRRPPSRPSTAPGRGLVPPQARGNFVTEARLEAALARVGAQIKTNSDAIQAVNSRANTISDNVAAQTAALKKEVEERKKDINALKSTVQLATLLPLLTRPTSKDVTGAVANTTLVQGDKVLVDKANTLTTLLPIMALGGFSSSSDGSSSAGSLGDSNPLLMLALAGVL